MNNSRFHRRIENSLRDSEFLYKLLEFSSNIERYRVIKGARLRLETRFQSSECCSCLTVIRTPVWCNGVRNIELV